jgi:signal transduction histidine kinase
MDEIDDYVKATYNGLPDQDSFSSRQSKIQDNNKTGHNEREKRNIVTKIVYGKETIPIVDNFARSCQSEINVIADKNGASLIINVSEIRKFYTILKDNSIKIRIVTEINPDNIEYCKQIIEKYNIELRHFSDIKFNLAISDGKESVGFTRFHENKALSEIIYSNAKEIVNQNKFVFETLWKKTIPFEERIREIEEYFLPLETYLINSQTDALSYVKDFINNAKSGFSNSTSIGYFKLLLNNETLFQSYFQYLSKYKEGKIKGGVKWVTHIDNNRENVELIKKFLDMGVEIRHVKNLPPLYFSVSQKQCVVTVESLTNGEMFQKIIHTAEPLYILHYQTVFEQLWNTGFDAQERIRQIQTGYILNTTTIIENPSNTKEYFIDMVKNAQKEILILFPSLNAIKREVIMGIIDLLKKKSNENVRIRILSPINERVKEIIFSESAYNKNLMKQNIISREIKKQDYLISTIVIVDRKYVLATELKDDSKLLFENAIGVSTYSTSKPTILSYISIFESLWDQTEMFDNIKTANEKLVRSEQLERDFINTAAHELRTPTQAIMGYAELGEETIDNILNIPKLNSDKELQTIVNQLKVNFEALTRNSRRLDELINNLLDVARIESNRDNSLQLHKERLDLVKEINDSIKTQLGQKIKDKGIKISIINDCIDKQCWIHADKLRINQIMNNLLGNAIKFSNQNGSINIIVKENTSSIIRESDVEKNKKSIEDIIRTKDREKKNENQLTDQILVSVSDTGKGISPLIMPKLFEKFVTGSEAGTGLGLYITRNLVEAHGGNIWAFNNDDGVGSTFVFTLPKTDNKIIL